MITKIKFTTLRKKTAEKSSRTPTTKTHIEESFAKEINTENSYGVREIVERDSNMPSTNQVQKTNLSALVRKKIRSNQKYVGIVKKVQRNKIYVHIEDAMVRCIKNDHLDMKISLPLQFSQSSIPQNSDLRWEDFVEEGCISLSIAENDWQIVEQISTEHYEQIKNKLWIEELLLNSNPHKNAIRLAPNNYIEAQNWLKITGKMSEKEGF